MNTKEAFKCLGPSSLSVKGITADALDTDFSFNLSFGDELLGKCIVLGNEFETSCILPLRIGQSGLSQTELKVVEFGELLEIRLFLELVECYSQFCGQHSHCGVFGADGQGLSPCLCDAKGKLL